jgi:hypothetical protein
LKDKSLKTTDKSVGSLTKSAIISATTTAANKLQWGHHVIAVVAEF